MVDWQRNCLQRGELSPTVSNTVDGMIDWGKIDDLHAMSSATLLPLLFTNARYTCLETISHMWSLLGTWRCKALNYYIEHVSGKESTDLKKRHSCVSKMGLFPRSRNRPVRSSCCVKKVFLKPLAGTCIVQVGEVCRTWTARFNNRNRKHDGAEGKRVCLRIRLIMLKSRKLLDKDPAQSLGWELVGFHHGEELGKKLTNQAAERGWFSTWG